MTATSRKEKAAETEAALKEAAKRVFATRGYLNTKITDITAEAGRSAGSFYNHFTSKEELLEALLADISATSSSNARTAGHNPDFSDPAAVRWHVTEYWRYYRENSATMLALRQASMVNDEFGRRMARFGANKQEDVSSHLTYVTDAGLRLPAPPQLTIAMMYQLIDGFAQMWLQGPMPDGWNAPTDEEAIEAMTRFVYRGFTGKDY
jgi:AcrR family transcriptional regulator